MRKSRLVLFLSSLVLVACGADDAKVMDAVSDPPRIASFTADRYFVEPGSTIEVAWSVEHAKEISLTANDETVDIGGSAEGSRSFIVDEEMVFRLEAGAGSVVSSRELRIGVRIPDSSVLILSFGANPREVDAGEPTRLEWVTRNATKIEVFDAQQNSLPLGGASAEEGFIEVAPDRTTSYRLVVTGEEGTVESTAMVQVRGEPKVEASVSSTSIQAGEKVSLGWAVQDALRVVVREVDGEVLVDSDTEFQGSVEVQPARSTTYEVRGVGVWRDSVQRVQVHVAPEILSFELVGDGPIGLGKLATLRWTTRGATELVVSNLDDDVETIGGFRIDEGSTRLPMAEGGSFRLTAIGGDGTTVVATVDGEVLGLPSIASFGVDPETQSAQLHPVLATVHWAGIENAERVKLETDTMGRMGIFEPPFEDGSLDLFLKETTTLTFTLSNGAGEVKRTVVATVVPLPKIADFFVFPSHAAVGEPVTVRWDVEGAASLRLRFNGQELPIDPSSGSYTHTTAEAGSFQLVAENSAGGMVERNLPLTVGLPQVVGLDAHRTILTAQEALHLSWSTRGGVKLTLLENGSLIHETTDPAEIAGGGFTIPSGTIATYVYTVRLENGLGDFVDRSIEVIRTDGPVLLSVSTPDTICEGEEFSLSWTMVPDSHGEDPSLSLSLDGKEVELTPQMAAQGSLSLPALPAGLHEATLIAHTPGTTPYTAEFVIEIDETRFSKLTASPSPATPGQDVTIEWETVCADSVIRQGKLDPPKEVFDSHFVDLWYFGWWVPLTDSCGTAFSPADEGCVVFHFPGGFTFPFDGVDRSAIKLYANGVAGFDLDRTGESRWNQALPATSESWANLAILWADLVMDPSEVGFFYDFTYGSSGKEGLIIQWGFMTVGDFFQMVLWEDGSIDYRFSWIQTPSPEAVIGYQDTTGSTWSVLSQFSTVPGGLHPRAWRFEPNPLLPPSGSLTLKAEESLQFQLKATGFGEVTEAIDIVVE